MNATDVALFLNLRRLKTSRRVTTVTDGAAGNRPDGQVTTPSVTARSVTPELIQRVSDAFHEYGRAVQQVTDYQLRADPLSAKKAEEHGRLIHDTTIQLLKDLT